MDFVSSSPLFCTNPPFFFQNFHLNHSFFKIFIIIRFSSFDNISRRHTSWILRVFCVHSFSTDTVLWTQNTRINHDVWRLLILSNEEKRMIMKILKREWFWWKFGKKGGRSKRNPCPMRLCHKIQICVLRGIDFVLFSRFFHRYLWTGPYGASACPSPFFLASIFFSCTQHFATFYVSLYDIYIQ